MKILIVFLFFIFAINLTQADESFILGLNRGISLTANVKSDFIGSVPENYPSSLEMDTSDFSIFLGMKDDENNRYLISYKSIEFKFDDYAKETAKGFAVDAEYVYTNYMIKPFWGIGIGSFRNSDRYEGESLKGISLHFKSGVKIEAHEHIELDFSIQPQTIIWQSVEFQQGILKTEVTERYNYVTVNFGTSIVF